MTETLCSANTPSQAGWVLRRRKTIPAAEREGLNDDGQTEQFQGLEAALWGKRQ